VPNIVQLSLNVTKLCDFKRDNPLYFFDSVKNIKQTRTHNKLYKEVFTTKINQLHFQSLCHIKCSKCPSLISFLYT